MDPFRAPVDVWTPLHPNQLKLKRLMVWLTWPVFFGLVSFGLWLFLPWWTPVTAGVVGLVWTTYRWSRQPRLWRSWGYAERATDLHIRHGLFWRSMTVVPYGRLQVVTVNSGPLERKFGLATVTLETASAGTDATIPGLAQADADALRDRLSTLGEQQLMGL